MNRNQLLNCRGYQLDATFSCSFFSSEDAGTAVSTLGSAQDEVRRPSARCDHLQHCDGRVSEVRALEAGAADFSTATVEWKPHS